MSEKEEMIDTVEAYELSGIAPARLAMLARQGEIPGAVQTGSGWQGWRFNRQAFLKWDDKRRETTD